VRHCERAQPLSCLGQPPEPALRPRDAITAFSTSFHFKGAVTITGRFNSFNCALSVCGFLPGNLFLAGFEGFESLRENFLKILLGGGPVCLGYDVKTCTGTGHFLISF